MPVKDIEDFKRQYYGIINDIALTPQDQRDGKALRWQKQLATLRLEAQGKSVSIQNFGCDFNTLQQEDSKSYLKELSDFYNNVREGQDVTQGLRDVSKLDIPDANKQEMKAQGFVLAFDEMKKNTENQEQFLKHYTNVQRMSHIGIPLKVENPQLQKELEHANNIVQAFTEKYIPEQGDVGKLFTEVIEQQRQVAEEQKAPILKVDENYSNKELSQSHYWYTDKDINAVLSQRLRQVNAQNIYQMDAVALHSGNDAEQNNQLTTDRIKTRLNEIGEPKAGKKLLIPVNVGGNHWIGAAVEFDQEGKILVTYTDSLGNPANRKVALDKLIGEAVGQDISQLSVIHDAPQKQQNGSDCGPLTVENLIRIVAPEQEITQNVRQQQAQLFSQFAQVQKQVEDQVKQKEQGKSAQGVLEQIKEQIARQILKIAGVSDGQIAQIMEQKDGMAKVAIMKRTQGVFDKIGVQDVVAFQKVKDEDLRGVIEKQSKEFIAQVGRTASWSMDNWDMRGNEKLHAKYTEKANKMKPADFDKNATKALEYETSKDKRNWKKSLLYNLYRKPMQLINGLRPQNDKPLLSPGQKALIGFVALAVLAPPFGAIVAAFMFLSAAKDVYKGSWLQKQVNKLRGVKPPPEKLQSDALKKVTARGLVEDIQKEAGKGVGQEKTKQQVVQQGKKEIDAKTKTEVQQIIYEAKKAVGQKPQGRQRSIDLEDFQLAQERLVRERANRSSARFL